MDGRGFGAEEEEEDGRFGGAEVLPGAGGTAGGLAAGLGAGLAAGFTAGAEFLWLAGPGLRPAAPCKVQGG